MDLYSQLKVLFGIENDKELTSAKWIIEKPDPYAKKSNTTKFNQLGILFC